MFLILKFEYLNVTFKNKNSINLFDLCSICLAHADKKTRKCIDNLINKYAFNRI